MPLPPRNPNDDPRMNLDPMGPGAPIVAPHGGLTEESDPACGDWRERLRTTTELLQKLSDVYPFTWHGNG